MQLLQTKAHQSNLILMAQRYMFSGICLEQTLL